MHIDLWSGTRLYFDRGWLGLWLAWSILITSILWFMEHWIRRLAMRRRMKALIKEAINADRGAG